MFQLPLAIIAIMSAPVVRADISSRQVIDRIKEHVGVVWKEPTVDTFKAGNPDLPIKGIAVTMMSTLDVLERAGKAGCNLVISHEPTFYDHYDKTEVYERENDAVYLAKQEVIKKYGLVIFRFHDYWHMRRPDGIMEGMIKQLGWDKYRSPKASNLYTVPEVSLQQLATDIKKRTGAHAMRVVGDKSLRIKNIGFSPGAGGFDGHRKLLQKSEVDVLVVGEAREWETVEYADDAQVAGKPKALIIIGHIPSEQAGMNECAKWLRTFVSEVPVKFIPTKDPFWMP